MKKNSFGTKAILALSGLQQNLGWMWQIVVKGSSINQVNQTNIELCKLWVNLVWVKNLIPSSSSSVGREWGWRSGGIAHICLKQTEYTDEPVSSKSSKTCKSSSVFSVLVHTPQSTFLTPVHPRNLFICLTAKSYLSLSDKVCTPAKQKQYFFTISPHDHSFFFILDPGEVCLGGWSFLASGKQYL